MSTIPAERTHASDQRALPCLLAAAVLLCAACGDDSGGAESQDGMTGMTGGGSAGVVDDGQTNSGSAGTATGTGGAPDAGGEKDPRAIANVEVGSIGSGDVECYGVADSNCGPGTACCDVFPFGDNGCVSELGQCECPGHSCAVYGCDGPEDCPGQQCCAARNPVASVNEFRASSCRDQCDPTMDVVVCAVDADCNRQGAECHESSASFKRCF